MSMLRVTVPALLLVVVAGACGGEDEGADGAPNAPEPALSEPSDDGGFAPGDYDYTLSMACYCPYAAVPVRVRVRGDSVTAAVFARSGGRGGARRGEDAPPTMAVTIDDLLAQAEAARSQGAAQVRVEWPEGSDHPTEIYIDRSAETLDEEVGWTISDVAVTGEGGSG